MDSFFTTIKQQFADNKWLQNLAAWLAFFLIFALTAQFDEDTQIQEVVVVVLSLMTMLAFPVYITNLLLLPLFRKGKYVLALILYFLVLLFFASISNWIVVSCYHFACNFMECAEDFSDPSIGSVYNLFGTNLFSTLIALAIRIARDNVVEKSKSQEAELQLLKGQLNPHFLFNTLNNLYGLSVIKSDKLPDLMLKLSDLLRYSLYQTRDSRVPLQHELTYLQNYLELERLRLDEEVELELQVTGTANTQHIAPMLLIVFVENAFKHFSAIPANAAFIKINIAITDHQLHFNCINSKDAQTDISPREQNASGIGLANVRQRLALLYPGQYQLEVQNNNATFKVDLQLSLHT